MSYIFIAGIVLFNVVVAVLLGEFIKFIGFEKDREAAEREAELDKMRVTGCLDPSTRTLIACNGEFGRNNFTEMMLAEFQRYSRRALKNCVMLTDNKVRMHEHGA